MPLLRRARAAAIGTALLATGCLATSYPVAFADPGQAVPAGCVQGGPTLRYLVVFAKGTSSADAAAQITNACGETTIYYAPIAVGVATSADPTFGDRIGPNRAYSAQAGAYAVDRSSDGARKSDELPSDPDGVVTSDASAVPTKDLSGQQWDMSMIKADQAHQVTDGSRNVLVGVLDSGIDPNHPQLTGALDRSASAGCVTGAPDTSESAWIPTTSSHGTHVAGTIAAADDGHGTVGVAPGVRVASVKVVDDDGYIYPEAAVCGFMWAAQEGMRIANNSYFVDPWVFTCADSPGQHVIYQAIDRAVTYATGHGVLSIAAAGNLGVDLTDPGVDSQSPDNVDTDDQQQRQLHDDCVQLPAGIPGVVTVSAVGANDVKAGYSSYGLGAVDVTAPGGDPLQHASDGSHCVLSTVPGGYASSCGTSMAAPHASGVAALLASTHPDATPKQLAQLLDSQADPIPCPADYDLNGTGAQDAYCTGDSTFNSFYGHGLVDALAAATSGTVPNAAPAQPATPAPPTPVIPTVSHQSGQPGALQPNPPQTATVPPTTTTSPPPPTPTTASVPQTPKLAPAGGPAGGFALLGF